MLAQKNLWRQKNRPKLFVIFDNFRIWSRISPERINIPKIGNVLENLQTTSTLEEKKFVYFGPQTTELIPLINLHPIDFFRETLFRPLGGAAPSNFYMYYRFTKAC